MSMTPGVTYPKNSVISIPLLYNRGNAPVMVPVNFPLTMHV